MSYEPARPRVIWNRFTQKLVKLPSAFMLQTRRNTALFKTLRRSETQHRQVFRTGISLWLLWRAGYNQHKFRRWDGFNLFLMDDADNGCWHVSVSDALEALRIFLRGVRSPCVAWTNHLFTPTDLKDIFPPRIGWKSWGVNFTGKPLQDVDTLQQAAGQPLRGKCSVFSFFFLEGPGWPIGNRYTST